MAVGDQVFGHGRDVAAQLAVLNQWAPRPASLDFTTAAGLPTTEMAYDAIREIGPVIEAGHFSLPVSRTFPLEDVAEAHRVSEEGHTRGKLVLVVD